MKMSICALLLCGAAAAAQGQVHAGDIVVRDDPWGRLRTAGSDAAGELVRGGRVFIATFGEAPNFTNDPGFDSGEETFIPGTSVGFDVLQALRVWDPGTQRFDDVPTERQSIRLGPLGPVLTPTVDQVVSGFSLTADGAGRFHHHLGYTLQSPARAGIYLLQMRLKSPTLEFSRPFYMVFNQNSSALDHNAAAQWVASNLACPADLNDDGAVDFGDFLEFFNAFDTLGGIADLNFDDSVDFADFLEFFNRFDAAC